MTNGETEVPVTHLPRPQTSLHCSSSKDYCLRIPKPTLFLAHRGLPRILGGAERVVERAARPLGLQVC